MVEFEATHSEHTHETMRTVHLDMSPSRCLRTLLVINTFLFVTHALFTFREYNNFYFRGQDYLRALFDLEGENNVPAVYSTLIWLLCAALCLLIGHATKQVSDNHWKVLDSSVGCILVFGFRRVFHGSRTHDRDHAAAS
jgi:hypothetical protein